MYRQPCHYGHLLQLNQHLRRSLVFGEASIPPPLVGTATKKAAAPAKDHPQQCSIQLCLRLPRFSAIGSLDQGSGATLIQWNPEAFRLDKELLRTSERFG